MTDETRLATEAGAPARSRPMTLRVAALPIVWAGLASAFIVLAWSNRGLSTIGPDRVRHDTVDMGFVFVMVGVALVYTSVGLTIVLRRRHVVGWLLLAVAVGFTGLFACEQYVLHAVVTAPGSLPRPLPVAMSTQFLAAVATASITLIVHLFPTGAPRSPRWRIPAAAVVPATLLYAASYLLTPDAVRGPWVDHGVRLHNPLAIPSLYGALRPVFGVGVGASLILAVVGFVALVMRFRTSSGIERRQVKWLSFVGIVVVLLFVSMNVLPRSIGDYLWLPFFMTLMLGIPLSIGAAILRYRLYDIDRIVSRTLSYALITGLLAGAYLGLVLLFQRVTEPFTEGSDLAVAASTLIVAAAFAPVRRRVQSLVDRRFNRARYDAERTIEAFSARLREQVDIDALGTELSALVKNTMQPSSVSLWLRGTKP